MNTSKRVIIVEDDKDINQLIAYNLNKEGFLVEQAYDGLKAKEMLDKTGFDIVILDIMLPGINGFDICREYKNKSGYGKSFFVVISAKSGVQDKLYANILGADFYFSKPFSVAELVNTAKEIRAMQGKEFLVKVK